jgi:hypothetical protein
VNGQLTKEDLERIARVVFERLERLDDSVEAMRAQNSAEHDSIFSKVGYVTELLIWIKTQWARFSRPSDPPPPEKSAFKP